MYHQLKKGSGNILGLQIIGNVTKKQKKQICEVLEKQINETGNIRLLLVIKPHAKMDAESLLFDLNFTLTYADNIERMTVVGDKAWKKTWIGLFGLFSRIRTKYFDHSEIEAAWKWVQS